MSDPTKGPGPQPNWPPEDAPPLPYAIRVGSTVFHAGTHWDTVQGAIDRLHHKHARIDVQADTLAKAMQSVWDDFCADTGHIPGAFRVHGPKTTRVSADFLHSDFPYKVAQELIQRLELTPTR